LVGGQRVDARAIIPVHRVDGGNRKHIAQCIPSGTI
jgi:hypothetical protein